MSKKKLEIKSKKKSKRAVEKPSKRASLKLTINDWMKTFKVILDQRGYSKQTLKNRRASNAHISRFWGKVPLRDLRPFEISSRIRELSPSCAIRVLSSLRDLYSEAVANGEAEINPVLHVKSPKTTVMRSRLTLDIWKRLLQAAEASPQKWLKPLLLLAMATGQRRGDLRKMKFDDIVDGCLRIEQQKKAGKRIGARVAIPLNFKIAAVGMTLGEVIELCRNCAKPGPNLLRQANGRSIEDSSLSARFHELIVSSEGPDAFTQYRWPSLHEVRSLSARTCLEEGMTPHQVQVLLGHSHVEMTLAYANDRGLSEGQWKQVDIAKPSFNPSFTPGQTSVDLALHITNPLYCIPSSRQV